MTEPQFCPTTLRWAAQHIRKFATGHTHDATTADEWDEWDTQVAYNAQTSAFEFSAESMDNWATEAELAAAKRKADPGCTCSPSPGAQTGVMLCPSCVAVMAVCDEDLRAYQEKFDAGLAASLEAAIELRAEELRGEPALTVDQDKVDEHYGIIA